MPTPLYFFPENTLGCYSYGCAASGGHCRKHLQVHKSPKPMLWGGLTLLPAHAPLPSTAGWYSLLQTATHQARAPTELETQHETHSQPRGQRGGLAAFKQPGFGNFGSQQESSLLTWTVDPRAFQTQLFDFRLLSSKAAFSDGGGGPTQGLLLGPSATLWPHTIWKAMATVYWKEALPTYSRCPQSH